MTTSPRISIVVPIHEGMKDGPFFLWRLVQSLTAQSFKDYELIIVQEGSMPVNTNAGIKKARGEIVKILFLDDYFAHPQSLQVVSDAFTDETIWLVTGCVHHENHILTRPHYPVYSMDISTGNNTIGSPSVLAFRNEGHLLFDENLSFLLDCDLYRRYYEAYGLPTVVNDLNVVIGIHSGQTSNTMPPEEKLKEFEYLKQKYA